MHGTMQENDVPMANSIRRIVPILIAVVIAVGAMADITKNPTQVSDAQLFAAMDLTRPELAPVADAVDDENYEHAAAAWAEYFRTRSTPRMHFDRAQWAGYIRENFPQLVEPMIAEADEIAAGNLTHGTIALPVHGREIDWFHNPDKDTNYVSIVGSQWFWQPVGRAYLLTGDKRYVQAFEWIFNSWYENRDAISEWQGDLGFEPIWRAYYPGVQTRVLCDAYYSLGTSEDLRPETHLRVLKHILGACSWLYAQEDSYRKGNQQVGAVVGLGVAGRLFVEFADSEDWVHLAETRMAEHLEHDFHPDGGHREICTQYHKTVLRDICHVALVARANGQAGLLDDERAAAGLERAIEWLLKLVSPTLETPPLHSAVFATDWAVYALIGAGEFQRADFKWLADRFWQQGRVPNQKSPISFANYLLCEQLKAEGVQPRRPDWDSVLLDSSGFAVMREGWDPDSRYLVFQYGQGNTGHAYPGALSFLLQDNGELIATHPGSPRSYRHPAYDYCKSSRAHNIVTIDLEDQPREDGIAPGGHLEAYSDAGDAWFVQASCDGYMESFGARIRRQIVAIPNGPLIIRDRIEGAAGHTAHWNLHIPLKVKIEGVSVAIAGRQSYTICAADEAQIITVRTARRWMAVRPGDCQPKDCGAMVNVVRLEKDISGDVTEYCVAICEGDGHTQDLGHGEFAVHGAQGRFRVSFEDKSVTVEQQ